MWPPPPTNLILDETISQIFRLVFTFTLWNYNPFLIPIMDNEDTGLYVHLKLC